MRLRKKKLHQDLFLGVVVPEGCTRMMISLCKHAFRNAWSDVLYDVLSLKEPALLSGSARKTGNSKKTL